MTVREVFNTVLPALGITQAEAVSKIGWTPQQMSQKNKRDSLRANEFFRIMEANGVEVLFRIKGEEELLTVRLAGHGHRIKGMADHVNYDTAAAGAISNSFYADGVNEYDENGEAQELYIDQQGRYFIAEYNINTLTGSASAPFLPVLRWRSSRSTALRSKRIPNSENENPLWLKPEGTFLYMIIFISANSRKFL